MIAAPVTSGPLRTGASGPAVVAERASPIQCGEFRRRPARSYHPARGGAVHASIRIAADGVVGAVTAAYLDAVEAAPARFAAEYCCYLDATAR